MKTFHDEPGSPAWHARRAACFNASDIAAAMGLCDHLKTRTALLHELHTGIAREFSDYVQDKIIDPGHRIEAAMRAVAEEIIGDDLAPLAGSLEVEGLPRPLGASFDGLDMLPTDGWENKRLNAALREALPVAGRDSADANDSARLPKMYRVQVEQQCLVGGLRRVLFTAADVDRDGNITDERHCWYYPDPALRAEILAAWKQFAADLAAYVPSTKPVEKIVAEPVQALPAVSVQVAGEISVISNFDRFEVALRDFLEHRLIRQPKTDQDFADLDVQIKAMKGAEAALEQAEGQMLAQLASVDAAKKTKDMLHKLVRDNRLMAEKLLTSEKERRKAEIVREGVAALREHIAGLNVRLGQPYMPASATAVDFGAAIKGLRSLDSMENAIATTLANAKIAASAQADRIEINLKALPGLVGDRTGLTPDLQALVLKEPGDFAAVVGQRVQAQREQEERRAAELAERERARIEAEALAKFQREEQERVIAETKARAAAERAAQAAAVPPAPAPTYPPAPPAQALATGPANVVPMPTKATAQALIKLGAINERIAPLSIDAAGLAALGFQPTMQGAAKMYSAADLPRMLSAMLQHLGGVQAKLAA